MRRPRLAAAVRQQHHTARRDNTTIRRIPTRQFPTATSVRAERCRLVCPAIASLGYPAREESEIALLAAADGEPEW